MRAYVVFTAYLYRNSGSDIQTKHVINGDVGAMGNTSINYAVDEI